MTVIVALPIYSLNWTFIFIVATTPVVLHNKKYAPEAENNIMITAEN